MELQGKKATHDFLSLYTKSSTYQHEDSTPPAAAPPPQGFFLKTQDFLRPLERPAENGGPRGGETTVAAAARVDIAVGGPAGRRGPAAVEHMLPGGIGTYSISHVPVEPPGGARAAAPAAVVKPEQRSSSGSGGGGSVGVVRGAFAGVPECGKPDPGYGHRSGYGSPYAPAGVEASPCAAWEEKDPAVGLRGGHAQQQRWSSLFAAGPAAAAAASASRYHAAPENRRFMEAATSRSSKGFDEEEDEDEERGRRDGSTSRKDLSIKVDGKGSGSDQRPNTPRSKHSATEQRRRSKINDRFQILRELIPHSDQKRDKASFLLEVIEYIRFLQERVQKYESSFPEWNQDTSKLMPWVKVYFRSFWKNARNNSQAHVDSLTDPSQVVKNGSASPYIFSGRFDESSIPVAPAMISSANNPSETDISSGAVYKSMENAPGFTSADNIASQDQSQWLRSSGPDCAVSNQIVSEQEELAIDEGTISVSAAYSQGLLSTLMQALQSSGIDLSQATVSVQINLGKRAMNKRNPAAVTPSNNKDADPAQVARFRASGEESSQAHKRQRVDNS